MAQPIVNSAMYFMTLGMSSPSRGYSWSEMDWNQEGRTSMSDFFAAGDIGKRKEMY
jgi:hypothetical protein